MSAYPDLRHSFIGAYRSLVEFGLIISNRSASEHFIEGVEKINGYFLDFLEIDRSFDPEKRIRRGERLLFQIKNVLNILTVFGSLGPENILACLKTQKRLLELEFELISEISGQLRRKAGAISTEIPASEKNQTGDAMETKYGREQLKEKLGEIIRKKLIITSHELYGSFPQVDKRNIRRIISELVEAEKIIRNKEGNVVIYRVNIRKSS